MKPSYKKTEVGVIPEEWDAKPIGSVLSKGRLGGNYANQDAEAELPLMKMGNLGRGHFDLSKVQFIAPGVRPELAHRLVYGDVLFNTRNTLDLVGKVAIWRDELPIAYYNSNLMRLEFDPEQVCSNEYASYSLNTEGAVSRLRALATGTTSVAAIYTRDLLKLQVLVPPKSEQRAIAEALSDVDGLLVGLDRLIAKKRDLKQAAMQQLLTGQTRLPSFHGEWEETTLGQIGECIIGLTYKPENVVEHGLLVLRSSNVQNGRVAYDNNVHVNLQVAEHLYTQLGDILICVRNGSRALIGKCAAIDSAAVGVTFGAFMSVYRTKHWRYVLHAFQADDIQRQIRDNIGATINQITNKDMKAFRLRLPPEDEQTAIAEVLTEMDAELAALEQRREKTRALKQAMMQELLTGRTRLV